MNRAGEKIKVPAQGPVTALGEGVLRLGQLIGGALSGDRKSRTTASWGLGQRAC